MGVECQHRNAELRRNIQAECVEGRIAESRSRSGAHGDAQPQRLLADLSRHRQKRRRMSQNAYRGAGCTGAKRRAPKGCEPRGGEHQIVLPRFLGDSDWLPCDPQEQCSEDKETYNKKALGDAKRLFKLRSFPRNLVRQTNRFNEAEVPQDNIE